jgi:hypothetical protein
MAGAPTGMGHMGHMRVGGSVFAGTMLLIVGFFEIVTGILGFVRGSWYLLRGNYLYEMNVTAWGWLLFGLGVLTVLAGIFAYTGAAAARPIGIAVVGLSIIANFFFIPFYAPWAVLSIALGIVALWALAMSGRQQQAQAGQEQGYGYGAAAPQMGGGQQQRWVTTNQPAYGNPEMAGRRAPDMSGMQGQMQGQPGPMQGQMPGPMQGQQTQGRGPMQSQQGMPQAGQHGERRA